MSVYSFWSVARNVYVCCSAVTNLALDVRAWSYGATGVCSRDLDVDGTMNVTPACHVVEHVGKLLVREAVIKTIKVPLMSVVLPLMKKQNVRYLLANKQAGSCRPLALGLLKGAHFWVDIVGDGQLRRGNDVGEMVGMPETDSVIYGGLTPKEVWVAIQSGVGGHRSCVSGGGCGRVNGHVGF